VFVCVLPLPTIPSLSPVQSLKLLTIGPALPSLTQSLSQLMPSAHLQVKALVSDSKIFFKPVGPPVEVGVRLVQKIEWLM